MERDIVVIGVSAGGVETLGRLVKQFPASLPGSIFVSMHFPAYGISVLPNILNHKGPLPAKHADDGELIHRGQIYVAPPNSHLSIKEDHIQLNRGPRENGYRPSIDQMFWSAAHTYGRRVIGVILSGTLDDGTVGLAMIKARGGTAIVQDPEEAYYSGMPRSAIQHVAVDYVLTVDQIAACLTKLVKTSIAEEAVMKSESIANEVDKVTQDKASRERGEHLGTPSPLTCPDCGGVLWELRQGDLLRYRCHIGHAYSGDSILALQSEKVERAL